MESQLQNNTRENFTRCHDLPHVGRQANTMPCHFPDSSIQKVNSENSLNSSYSRNSFNHLDGNGVVYMIPRVSVMPVGVNHGNSANAYSTLNYCKNNNELGSSRRDSGNASASDSIYVVSSESNYIRNTCKKKCNHRAIVGSDNTICSNSPYCATVTSNKAVNNANQANQKIALANSQSKQIQQFVSNHKNGGTGRSTHLLETPILNGTSTAVSTNGIWMVLPSVTDISKQTHQQHGAIMAVGPEAAPNLYYGGTATALLPSAGVDQCTNSVITPLGEINNSAYPAHTPATMLGLQPFGECCNAQLYPNTHALVPCVTQPSNNPPRTYLLNTPTYVPFHNGHSANRAETGSSSNDSINVQMVANQFADLQVNCDLTVKNDTIQAFTPHAAVHYQPIFANQNMIQYQNAPWLQSNQMQQAVLLQAGSQSQKSIYTVPIVSHAI